MATRSNTRRQPSRRRLPVPATAAAARQGLAQVRALSHPLRLRLLEVFAEGPRTTKQAAERLGQPPTRLYHHVAALERAGLVVLRETRPNRGTIEKYYEVAARRFELDTSRAARMGARAARRNTAATTRGAAAMGLLVLERAGAELTSALARCSEDTETPIVAVRGVIAMSAQRAKRFQRELVGMVAKQRERPSAGARRGRAGRQRYSITLVLVPVDSPADEG